MMSCRVTMPTTLPSSSTTGTRSKRCLLISVAACARRVVRPDRLDLVAVGHQLLDVGRRGLLHALLELLLALQVDDAVEDLEVVRQRDVGVHGHQVALGDDADQLAVVIDHRRAADALVAEQRDQAP